MVELIQPGMQSKNSLPSSERILRFRNTNSSWRYSLGHSPRILIILISTNQEMATIAIPAIELGQLFIAGLTIFLLPLGIKFVEKIAELVATKHGQKDKKGQEDEECPVCGSKCPQRGFWDSLPYRNGKYRATQTHCYYKENFHANKTRLEVFRRSGKRPHAGDCCMECGTQQTGPKNHSHPQDCPF